MLSPTEFSRLLSKAYSRCDCGQLARLNVDTYVHLLLEEMASTEGKDAHKLTMSQYATSAPPAYCGDGSGDSGTPSKREHASFAHLPTSLPNATPGSSNWCAPSRYCASGFRWRRMRSPKQTSKRPPWCAGQS